ncbi:MAG: hypothetical protein JKY53_14470, partial [Flavobacteriales bacterium]|nr:hypothetical protein [Flavobacteriales bacterium]
NPSFKILYQSLDKKIRFGIQAKIDGVTNEVAASVAGGVLAIIALISFIGLIHYSYILVLIIGAWAWISIKLYTEYQDSLKSSLARLQTGNKTAQSSLSLNDILVKNIGTNNDLLSSVSIKLQQRLQPIEYDQTALNLNLTDSSLKKRIELPHDPDEIRTLARSKSIEDRILLAKTIKGLDKDNEHEISIPLGELIKDAEPEVRIEAIKAIALQRVSELYHNVIDLLDSPTYRNAAYNAIISVGEDMLDLMELSFHKTGFETQTRVLMVKSMGVIGGQKAISLLIGKTNFPDRKIVNESFNALKKCEFEPDENIVNKMIQEIDNLIGIAAWNISAQKSLNEANVSKRMLKAIEAELKLNFESIYLLLELAYDAKLISHIKDSVESGASESIGFAIELLDLFINEDLKPKLFPLLEDISDEDRIDQLELHYAIEQGSVENTLTDIINKDYNYSSKWTKLCAIHELDELADTLPQVIIANIFNPDKLIHESAAWVTYNKDKSQFFDCLNRIDEKEKARLIALICDNENSFNSLLFSKLTFLKNTSTLESTSNETLYEIARNLKTIEVKVNEEFSFEEEITGFVASGEVEIEQNQEINKITSGGIFGNLTQQLENNYSKIVAVTESTCYIITDSKLFELITKEPSLLNLFYAPINSDDKLKVTTV